MMKPNKGRIIIELLRRKQADGKSQIFIPGRENKELLAGENLFVGRVVDPGEAEICSVCAGQSVRLEAPSCVNCKRSGVMNSFREGQLVMFNENSMAAFYKDIQKLATEDVPDSELKKPENLLHVIAECDIMAAEELVD